MSSRPPRDSGPSSLADHLLPPQEPAPAFTRAAKALPWLRRPTWVQLLVSGLVAGLGLLGAQALGRVDQDLRSLYTEYTLAATNLAHISSDLLRYRTTILRAIEAPTRKDCERIMAALPDQEARVHQAIERYAEASRRVGGGRPVDERDLQALRSSLHAYFAAAEQTRALLARLWQARSPQEAAELRHQTELHAAENAGPKLVEASDALERLLTGVAAVGKDMRDEGTSVIQTTSVVLLLGGLLLAALNLLA
jgi:hypothetical protein